MRTLQLPLAWLPVDSLQLTARIGYVDSQYAAGGFSDAHGLEDEPAFAPDWTMRFAGVYTCALGERGALQFSAGASYRGAMQFSVENTAALAKEDYCCLAVSSAGSAPPETWTVTAGITNATDEAYKVEGQDFCSVANMQTASRSADLDAVGRIRVLTVSIDHGLPGRGKGPARPAGEGW